MQYEISHVHYIINWTQADGTQFILQPFRAFLNRNAFDAYARITKAGLCIFHDYFNSRSSIINFESIHARTFQSERLAILFQVSSQITGYTKMRSGIHTVRSYIDFQYIVALDIIIILCKSSYNHISWQHDDSGVVSTNTYFIFRTNHTI